MSLREQLFHEQNPFLGTLPHTENEWWLVVQRPKVTGRVLKNLEVTRKREESTKADWWSNFRSIERIVKIDHFTEAKTVSHGIWETKEHVGPFVFGRAIF